jgi:hypothetical protein
MGTRALRWFGFRGFALTLALALASCAASAPSPDAQPRDSGAVADAQPAPSQKKMRTGGPLPPERVTTPDATPIAIDTTCKTDADCTVKNVGNCCGYSPACVNVDSPTDPQGVQARCAKEGMASVCGFQEISACSCKQGRCEAASSKLEPTEVVHRCSTRRST